MEQSAKLDVEKGIPPSELDPPDFDVSQTDGPTPEESSKFCKGNGQTAGCEPQGDMDHDTEQQHDAADRLAADSVTDPVSEHCCLLDEDGDCYSQDSHRDAASIERQRHHSASTLALPTTTSTPCSLAQPHIPGHEAKSENSSALLSICRICHLPGDERDPLLSPCRCAGTLQYIHNSCLVKWLEVMTKKSRKPPKCELCHYPYNRHKKFKLSQWRFPRVSRQDKALHVIFIVNLIIMITCAVATVMCFLSDKGQITKFARNRVDLTTEEIITLSCGVLFFVSFFIAMSVQIKAKYTVYQLFVKFILQNMEWEIDEYDKAKDALYKAAPIYRAPMSYV